MNADVEAVSPAFHESPAYTCRLQASVFFAPTEAGTYENLKIGQELAKHELVASVSMVRATGFEFRTKRL